MQNMRVMRVKYFVRLEIQSNSSWIRCNKTEGSTYILHLDLDNLLTKNPPSRLKPIFVDNRFVLQISSLLDKLSSKTVVNKIYF